MFSLQREVLASGHTNSLGGIFHPTKYKPTITDQPITKLLSVPQNLKDSKLLSELQTKKEIANKKINKKSDAQTISRLIESGEIANLLQLNRDFCQKLKQTWHNQDTNQMIFPAQIILDLMSQECGALPTNLKSTIWGPATLFKILISTGFCCLFAYEFSKHILSDWLDMSLWEWIEHFITSSLDRIISRGIQWSQEGINTLVKTQYSANERQKVTQNFKKIDTLKILKSSIENMSVGLSQNQDNDIVETSKFWFHGTSSKNADNIIQNGINLRHNKERGNFSNGDGFYLTDNLSLAIYFAYKKFCLPSSACTEIVIVVFSYKNDPDNENLLKKYEPLGIDLRVRTDANEDRLRKIVAYFSNGAEEVANMADHGLDPLYNHYITPDKMIQFIAGPFASFIGQGRKRSVDTVQINWGYDQLCLRAEPIKHDFELNIASTCLKVDKTDVIRLLFELNGLKIPYFIKAKTVRYQLKKIAMHFRISSETFLSHILRTLMESKDEIIFENEGK